MRPVDTLVCRAGRFPVCRRCCHGATRGPRSAPGPRAASARRSDPARTGSGAGPRDLHRRRAGGTELLQPTDHHAARRRPVASAGGTRSPCVGLPQGSRSRRHAGPGLDTAFDGCDGRFSGRPGCLRDRSAGYRSACWRDARGEDGPGSGEPATGARRGRRAQEPAPHARVRGDGAAGNRTADVAAVAPPSRISGAVGPASERCRTQAPQAVGGRRAVGQGYTRAPVSAFSCDRHVRRLDALLRV